MILFLGVIAMVVLTFERAPVADRPVDMGEAPPAPLSRMPGGDNRQRTGWAAGRTELLRAADGHFYAEAAINGRPVRLLVDTGASVVALTGEDARAIGLFWSEADIQPVGSGASGPVEGVPVRLDRVQLGDHREDAVEAVIIPERLAVSLLGQSFLRTIDSTSVEGDRMVLGE